MNSPLLKIVGILALIVALVWAIQYRVEWLKGKIWLIGFKYRETKQEVEEQLKMMHWLFFVILAEMTSPKYWKRILLVS